MLVAVVVLGPGVGTFEKIGQAKKGTVLSLVKQQENIISHTYASTKRGNKSFNQKRHESNIITTGDIFSFSDFLFSNPTHKP